MALIDDIRSESRGALFRRCDLHIHSFGEGGSYDVSDTAMSPEAIVDTAIAEGLSVIAITDHNRISNVRRALAHAEGKELLVIPGVELSTPQGHLLVYFASELQLSRFFGMLEVSDDSRSCSNTISQCLKIAEKFDGFGICAHIDLDSGFARMHPKFDTFKQEVFNCANLLALEVSSPDARPWFTHGDSDEHRRKCAVDRCKSLNLEEGSDLPKIISSDAHSLRALGRNARGDRRVTRLKMESLTFAALKIALIDSSARVRLEDLIPLAIPKFVGMRIDGGFLKDQIVHFSSNLTCIIGGRGAGKSTLLESLRAASGNPAESALVDSEVWPDEISLIYEDEVGKLHTLTRSKMCEVANEDRQGPNRVSIESYGQGQTASTIQRCGEDPAALLRFLDEFVDLRMLRAEDIKLRDEIRASQVEIACLKSELAQVPQLVERKKILDNHVAELKTQNAQDVVKLEEKIARESRIRADLTKRLSLLTNAIANAIDSGPIRSLVNNTDAAGLVVGSEDFNLIRTSVLSLADEIDQLSSSIRSRIASTNSSIEPNIQSWKDQEADTRRRIEEIRQSLEKKNVQLDIAFIRKTTKEAAEITAQLTDLDLKNPKLVAAQKKHRALLESRAHVCSRIFNARLALAESMNKKLADAVSDYHVKIKFHQGKLSDQARDLIKTTMKWRTSQVPRAERIASSISPLELLDAVNASDPKILQDLKDDAGNRLLSSAEATEVIQALSAWEPKCALERVGFDDRPEIKVTKTVENSGVRVPIVRDFSKLSLGQQQAILLTILLFSESRSPLIIDQPEDNLDGEFIYKTVVSSLRRIKEFRQVIIVTHNPNIAVLGDAELIIPLRGASELSVIRDRGSIDTDRTKEIVCTILEGSQKAFQQRHKMYGH